ncbi:MAG TPA: TetR/AcrR family transcriptional regulator [Acidimicrobiales bacterium]|nr:TetR/AcrR family transcriptional regulator [Acidimicrobiales bacterium]
MEPALKVDGRRARGLRTRDAIVAALMELVAGGDLSPTAQRIADRAGVSVRSVYQHFSDVEGLFQETSSRNYEWAMAMVVDIDQTWPLKRRIDAFVAERSAVLEELTPFSRASRLIEPASPALRESRLLIEKEIRDELTRVFAPELSMLEPPERAVLLGALDVVTTWAAWDHLRNAGIGVKVARQIMRAGVACLLRGAAGPLA